MEHCVVIRYFKKGNQKRYKRGEIGGCCINCLKKYAIALEISAEVNRKEGRVNGKQIHVKVPRFVTEAGTPTRTKSTSKLPRENKENQKCGSTCFATRENSEYGTSSFVCPHSNVSCLY